MKLSDFGLARDIGANLYRSKDPENNVLPVAWTAPEAFDGDFSIKSDVWAFGVLIWEVFSWASYPYGQCSGTGIFYFFIFLSHIIIYFEYIRPHDPKPREQIPLQCSCIQDLVERFWTRPETMW